MTRIKFDIDVRRRGDLQLVKESLVALATEKLGLEPESVIAGTRRRGGGIGFHVDTQLDLLPARAAAGDITDVFNRSAWWIDVLDKAVISLWVDAAEPDAAHPKWELGGFAQTEFKGWLRGEARRDLAEGLV